MEKDSIRLFHYISNAKFNSGALTSLRLILKTLLGSSNIVCKCICILINRKYKHKQVFKTISSPIKARSCESSAKSPIRIWAQHFELMMEGVKNQTQPKIMLIIFILKRSSLIKTKSEGNYFPDPKGNFKYYFHVLCLTNLCFLYILHFMHLSYFFHLFHTTARDFHIPV